MPLTSTAFRYKIDYTVPTIVRYGEEELVAMLKKRSDKAYSYLYDNYSNTLHGVILDFVNDHDRANDITQEVFLKIYRKIDTYDASKSRLYTWMVNITRHLCIDELRSKEYRNQQRNIAITPFTDMHVIGITQKTDTIGLHKLLENIKPKFQEIIHLIYYQGYTSDEISKLYNIPLGTVKTRLRAALLQLRQYA